jgi:UDP-N-acetylglucosamine 2-epimerase (non-hydrolysing)
MKIIVAAGARPNFMKVAPILTELARRRSTMPDVQVLLVHTGQHYDRQMSEEFFCDLGLPEPDVNLAAGAGSHAEQTARVLTGFEAVCMREKPDWVVVVGDVNSTLACTLAAKKLSIRVAHVEAGLRSGDWSMPEEINRLCTDAISDLLFTTDLEASSNLAREGVARERIHFAGNTMIDTLLRHLPRALASPLPAGVRTGEFAVLTLHRPATVDAPQALAAVLEVVAELATRVPVVFPVHPRTRKNIDTFGLSRLLHSNVLLLEPLSYLPFIGLAARSRMILTDSGGIQEEATVLGIPCITLRSNTERPITCTVGTNILAGTDPRRMREAIGQVLEGRTKPASVPDKWDGHAAKRIVQVLLSQEAGITRAAEREIAREAVLV